MDDPRLGPIDDTLAVLEAGLPAMTAKLVDIEAEAGRQFAESASLTGITAAHAEQALATVSRLWTQYLLLQGIVEQARTLRSSRRHLDVPRVDELDRLVHGESVSMTAPAPVTALGRRSTPTGVSMTPRDLYGAMERALDAVSIDIAAIEAAWAEGLARLEVLTATWQSLTVAASEVGEEVNPDLISGGELVRAAALAMGFDPLSQSAVLDDAEARLSRAQSRIVELKRRRDGLPGRLEAAHRSLEAVAATAAEGQAAGDRAREKIADPEGLQAALSPGVLDDDRRGLRPWLARLTAGAQRGAWREADADLDEWERAAAGALATAQQVVDANSAPLDRRAELRGRLDGLSAKAARLGLREDPVIDAVRAQARAVLYSAPCDLRRADALVNSLAVTLSRQHQAGPTAGRPGQGERRR
jgi:hypothetical protein